MQAGGNDEVGSCATVLYDYLRAGQAWKAPRTEEVAEENPNLVPMDVDSLHHKGGRGKKGKGKVKNKGDRPRHDGKGEGEQSVRQRYFDGYCNQCGEYGHKKPDCAGKSKFFNGTCNKCRAHGHKRVDCPFKMVAHLQSESVAEPNEEPTEVESLEWLCVGTRWWGSDDKLHGCACATASG